MCCISWIQATLEPNNVRGQIHLASSAELHRTDLAELSLSPEALCCTALCALWCPGERPPLLHPCRVLDHLSGLIRPHCAVSRPFTLFGLCCPHLGCWAVLQARGSRVCRLCKAELHFGLVVHIAAALHWLIIALHRHKTLADDSACPGDICLSGPCYCPDICVRIALFMLPLAFSAPYVNAATACAHPCETYGADMLQMFAAPIRCAVFVMLGCPQPAPEMVRLLSTKHNITAGGLLTTLQQACIGCSALSRQLCCHQMPHGKRNLTVSPCSCCCCSGYTRKEPFANNFAGLNWTPK